MSMMIVDGHLGGYILGGDDRTYYPALWQAMIDRWALGSVLDIGCAEGHAMEWFSRQGVRVLGVEGCAYAIRCNKMPQHIVQHDFSEGPWTPTDEIDLAWCCEVVEHIDEQHLPNLLAAFATARVAAITHAVPGQTGWHHVNCRNAGYWIERFQEIGMAHSAELTEWAKREAGHGYFAATGLVFTRP